MSRTLSRIAEGTPSSRREMGGGRWLKGFGWRRLLVVAAIAALASFLIPMLIQLSLEPFLVAMAVPFILGLLLMLRWPQVGVAWLGVVSLAELLSSAPFLLDALTHPESVADFLPLSIFTVSTLVGSIAAIPALRERNRSAESRSARRIAISAGAVVFACAALSVVASANTEDVPAQEGDISMVTEDLEFQPVDIDAEGTTISVHVTNRDDTRHTLTIDELEVDLNLPPNTAQRVSFEADPGTYRFFCRPHDPTMEGELTVR